jgi:hypothetical protein
VLLVASALVPARAELVVNGGFEDGQGPAEPFGSVVLAPGSTALPGWEVINGNVAWLWVFRGVGFARPELSRLINLRIDQQFGGIRQTIATVPGSEYRLSFSLGGGLSRPGAVAVSAGTSQKRFLSPPSVTISSWGRYELAFVATDTATTIEIVGTYGVHVLLDDVSVAGPTADQVGLEALTLRTSEVPGCRNVLATVTLTTPASPGGLFVSIGDTLEAADTPVRVRIREGETSKTFAIKTTAVTKRQTGVVSATLGSTTLTQPLAIRPIGPKALRLAPRVVAGTQPVDGLVELECPAQPNPITVNIVGDDESVARPVATAVVVPQGLQSVAVDLVTSLVEVRMPTTIVASANGIARSARLAVTPPLSVSARRLTFDDQAVGTASSALTATLTNEAAVPIRIDEIGLAGRHSASFELAENCPETLAAGASCTISVRFAPLAVAPTSARVVVATSATLAPLVIWLSGTGI